MVYADDEYSEQEEIMCGFLFCGRQTKIWFMHQYFYQY